MKNGHRARRGRPQKPDTTELMAALILRQIAMSNRTAAKINKILDTHVRRGDVARLWVRMVEDVKAHLVTLAERARTRLKLKDADMAVLQTLLDEAAQELVVSDEDRELAALPPLPERPRAVVGPVASLAAARAQAARLHSRWIDLRERIVPPTRRAS